MPPSLIILALCLEAVCLAVLAFVGVYALPRREGVRRLLRWLWLLAAAAVVLTLALLLVFFLHAFR